MENLLEIEEQTALPSAKIDLQWLRLRKPYERIGDGQVQQLNVNDFYELGKKTEEIRSRIDKFDAATVPLSAIGFPLFVLKMHIEALLSEPCALLPASQRAAKAIVNNISNTVPDDPSDLFDPAKNSVEIHTYQLSWVKTAIAEFETILKNDMPEMSTFAVAQIGIYRTDDLIREPYRQIAEPLRGFLQDKAKADIIEAGRCLAFRVSTAAAFHACRAIETCIDQYYEALVGKPYEVSANGGNNNWGAKTEALKNEGASEKVTEFLTHIRKQYRNPVTHPDVVVDEHEAMGLFSASLSSISMMLGEIKTLEENNQPFLTGLAAFAGGLYGTGTSSEPTGLQSGDEENPLGLEAGASAKNGSGEAV